MMTFFLPSFICKVISEHHVEWTERILLVTSVNKQVLLDSAERW
jgi:hypothetical protein